MTARRDGRQRSVTGSILNRDMSVVVFHPDDSDRATLTSHLKRMGFKVQAFWPPLAVLPEKVDLVFYTLVPQEQEPPDASHMTAGLPVIAIITYESPTFIDQAVKMGADAIITTPIRASGLLASVVMAMQHARQHRQMTERITGLEQRLSGARYLTEAKSILIAMHRISEAEAYEMLRGRAMARRVSVEDMCHAIIQAGDLLKGPRPVVKSSGSEASGDPLNHPLSD